LTSATDLAPEVANRIVKSQTHRNSALQTYERSLEFLSNVQKGTQGGTAQAARRLPPQSAKGARPMSDTGLEPKHNLAIRQEIGERLRILLPVQQTEMPAGLRELVRRFEGGNGPSDDARRRIFGRDRMRWRFSRN
jgi:hypothetical protein